MIRLLVVDDHELVRVGLRHILAGYPSIDIAGEATDGETAIRLNRELKPDVVLLDISLPGLSGFEGKEDRRRPCVPEAPPSHPVPFQDPGKLRDPSG